MRPFPVVEVEVTAKAIEQHRDVRILLQVNVLVFHGPPQALYEDIVEDPAAAVHADPNARSKSRAVKS